MLFSGKAFPATRMLGRFFKWLSLILYCICIYKLTIAACELVDLLFSRGTFLTNVNCLGAFFRGYVRLRVTSHHTLKLREHLRSGKKRLSGFDSPYIQTEKSYLIALNYVKLSLPLDLPFTLCIRITSIQENSLCNR
jgi:hypothetical protein